MIFSINRYDSLTRKMEKIIGQAVDRNSFYSLSRPVHYFLLKGFNLQDWTWEEDNKNILLVNGLSTGQPIIFYVTGR